MACFAILVYMPVVFRAMALTCTVTSRSLKNKSPGTSCRTLRVPGGSLNTTDTMAASATTLAGNMASQGPPFLGVLRQFQGINKGLKGFISPPQDLETNKKLP